MSGVARSRAPWVTVSQPTDPTSRPGAPIAETPATRPLERFWPYAELAEEPSAEELAALDPDLHAALFGAPPGPFSISLQFPPFDAPDYAEAVALAKASRDERRHRATFHSADAAQLRSLFHIVGRFDTCEVLVDGRPVPYARELWLPLVWFLLR